jgi:hypothetical protein
MSIFATSDRSKRLPAEPMRPVIDPAAWTRDSLGSMNNFSYYLTESHRTSLIEAVSEASRKGIAVADVSSDNFLIKLTEIVALHGSSAGRAILKWPEFIRGYDSVLLEGTCYVPPQLYLECSRQRSDHERVAK